MRRLLFFQKLTQAHTPMNYICFVSVSRKQQQQRMGEEDLFQILKIVIKTSLALNFDQNFEMVGKAWLTSNSDSDDLHDSDELNYEKCSFTFLCEHFRFSN